MMAAMHSSVKNRCSDPLCHHWKCHTPSELEFCHCKSKIMGADTSACCNDDDTTVTTNSQKRQREASQRTSHLGDTLLELEDDEVSVSGSDVSQGSLCHLQHTDSQRGFAITEFKEAIEDSDEMKAMKLVEEYSDLDLNDIIFDDGGNCLHQAVQFKQYTVIVFLLDNGISVQIIISLLHFRLCMILNYVNYDVEYQPNGSNTKNGDTPLHIAVREKNHNIVLILLMQGANPALENNAGKTPIDIAKKMKLHDIVEILEDDDDPKGICV